MSSVVRHELDLYDARLLIPINVACGTPQKLGESATRASTCGRDRAGRGDCSERHQSLRSSSVEAKWSSKLDRRQIECTASDLKRLQNDAAAKKIVSVVQYTALLYGTDSYLKACEKAIAEHGIAAGALLDDKTEPVLFVPLASVDPGEGEKVLDGGLLVTLSDGAIIAWNNFRKWGFGMCSVCASSIPYEVVEDASKDGALFTVVTSDRRWQFIPRELP